MNHHQHYSFAYTPSVHKITIISTRVINRIIRFLVSAAINSLVFIVLTIAIIIALPIIFVLSVVFITIVLSLLLLFALFAHLYTKEEELKQRLDIPVVVSTSVNNNNNSYSSDFGGKWPRGSRYCHHKNSVNNSGSTQQENNNNHNNGNTQNTRGGRRAEACIFTKLPNDVVQFHILPHLSHIELLTSTRAVNKRLHFLIKEYYDRSLLYDINHFRNSCLVQLLSKEWQIDNSLSAQRALMECVSASRVWNETQKQQFRQQVHMIESRSIIWTVYKKFLEYSNVAQWHDDMVQVISIYHYGIRLCCMRPRTFFKLLLNRT